MDNERERAKDKGKCRACKLNKYTYSLKREKVITIKVNVLEKIIERNIYTLLGFGNKEKPTLYLTNKSLFFLLISTQNISTPTGAKKILKKKHFHGY
jgi:hypothetical protein